MTTRPFTDPGVTETFSGRGIDMYDLRPEDICVEDIAHHLANECRFTGACSRRYSVGEHSLLVRRFVWQEDGASPEVQLAALMHDAFEAYAKDIATPQKTKEYKLAEANGMKVISTTLGFEYPHPAVLHADTILRWLECDALMPSHGVGWKGYEANGRRVIERYGKSAHAKRLRTGPGQERIIEELFLQTYHELKVTMREAAEATR